MSNTITIDGIEHDVDGMTDDQKALYHAIQYCDLKVQDVQNELAAIQTARQAYVNDLGTKLKED